MTENKDAQKMYETFCNMLENIHWKFRRDDDKLVILTSAIGNDLSMPLQVVVSASRNVLYIKSHLPFTVPRDMIGDVSVALHLANYSMLNGCFEYDINTGYVGFKVVMPFGGCLISEETCHYLTMLTCNMVDKFNDKLDKLIKKEITLLDFKKFVESN